MCVVRGYVRACACYAIFMRIHATGDQGEIGAITAGEHVCVCVCVRACMRVIGAIIAGEYMALFTMLFF